ncbi:MAG: hypothetical protein NTX75_07945 [Proteobacteria bacterium]|nr:hypothetical protein [Pseudomonadota bacterium]
MQTFFNNRGVSLVVLIVIMLGMALIGGGVATIMSSKQKSYPFALNSFKAYEIANVGIECTIAWVQDTSNPNKGLLTLVNNLTNISFGGGTFSTVISGTSPNEILTSTGTFNNMSRVVTLTNFATYAASSSSGDVNFDSPADMAASFVPMESQSGQAIVVNATTGVISLGQGEGATETYGAIWYGGNSTAGNCVSGSCDFRTGFRAYFVFQFATGSTGDGFTFAIINGASNTVSSIGGDTNMGELMAYGGDSRLYDGSGYINAFRGGTGNGLQPPKFAVEFDIYPNPGGCSPPSDPCGAGSRCDDPSNEHMAYIFWGDNNRISCQDYYTRWLSSFSFLANTVVYGTTGGNTYLYRSSAGTSSATQPTWPSTQGATRSDNTITWTEYTWRPSQQYTLTPLDRVVPTARNGHRYKVYDVQGSGSNKGKSSGSEPSWSTTTNWISPWDNNVRWQENGAINFVTNSCTYDDNKHTAGTGGNTGNSSGTGPTNTTSSNSYYTSPTNPTTWLADTGNSSTVNPKYAYRMEVVRNSGTQTYTIRSWIKTCTDGTANCDMYTNDVFGNVSLDYDMSWSKSTAYSVGTVVYPPTTANGHHYICTTAGTSGSTEPAWPTGSGATRTDGTVVWTEYGSYGPFLERTITLDSTYNTAFNKFLFGWTVATGAATQIADVRKFRITFKP